jgi:hypothetical protein
MEHGTISMYQRTRCRCEPCVLANRDYRRQHMRQYRGKGIPDNDPRHATTAGYNAGCKCVPCTTAHRDYQRTWAQQKRSN